MLFEIILIFFLDVYKGKFRILLRVGHHCSSKENLGLGNT